MIDIMPFMESMGTSNIPLVAAFFIGLMMSLSPCPLATNITAIAYVSKKIGNGKNTLITGLFYTLGRMLTYVSLSTIIVYIGVNVQMVSLFLQKYGEIILGPLLLFVGLVLLNIIKLPFMKGNSRFEKIKETLSEKGHIGSLFLGSIFALAFCPFSAVLFFGMLIPLALSYSDGIVIPSVFSFATGLPVILLSFVLVFSVSKIGSIMHKIQLFEKYTRYVVASIFVLMGLSYILFF